MVIRASAGKQVDSLIADLSSTHPQTRDSAVARLTVIDERAVGRLVALVALVARVDAGANARVAALHALEGIGDQRAFEPALKALDDKDTAVAAAAVAVLQTFLKAARGVDALDRLTALALDVSRPRTHRLAAIRALRDLGASTIDPLLATLDQDPDEAISAAAGLGPEAAADPVHILKEAADGTKPDTATGLRVALSEAAAHVPLPVLQRLVERVRFREGAETGARRAEWAALRGAAHAALAQDDSRYERVGGVDGTGVIGP